MKKVNLILFVLLLFAGAKTHAQGYSAHEIYGDHVQFYCWGPSGAVNPGEKVNLYVTFRQNPGKPPYNKNGDMDKEPSFPSIAGCKLMSPVSVKEYVEGEGANKVYVTDYKYTVKFDEPGICKIENVKITYRGRRLTADPLTFPVVPTVAPKIDISIFDDNESDASAPDVVVYEKPFVRKGYVRASLDEIRAYADKTEVDVSYTSKGENVWLGNNYFIRDVETKEKIMLEEINGDVGFQKKYFPAGTTVHYTAVFPALKKSWRNIDIVEVDGFTFHGVGLARKPGEQNLEGVSAAPLGKQIAQVDWSNARKVQLNNYSSDFLFTDGMVPVYNKDVHKWGFFDEKGNLAVPFKWNYDTFSTPHFGGGYCIVSIVRKVNGFYYTDYYVIDKTGKSVKLPKVNKVTPFSEDGYAAVVKDGGRYVYINGKGQEVFANLVQYIGSSEPFPVRPYRDGLSACYDYKKELYGFINKQGQWVIRPRFKDVHDFSEGLAAVQLPASNTDAAKWGFVNTKGELVIPAQFTYEPSSFSLGRAVVRKRTGAKVMIDNKGQVVSPEFDNLFPFFSTGYTLAQQKGELEFYVVDSDYHIVAGPVYGVDYKHRKYKEYHGAFQTPVFGEEYGDAYAYLTTGEPFFKDYSWKQTGVMSENLIHFKGSDGDGFVDYQGNVVFQFVASEF